jgi:small subunit ribosomal protein S20
MLTYNLLIIPREVSIVPNIKSAAKRVKVSKTKTARNIVIKSSLKTAVKKAKEAIENKSDNVAEVYGQAMVALDKSVNKRILKKNTAARKKSKLSKAYNAVASK